VTSKIQRSTSVDQLFTDGRQNQNDVTEAKSAWWMPRHLRCGDGRNGLVFYKCGIGSGTILHTFPAQPASNTKASRTARPKALRWPFEGDDRDRAGR